jgi:flagellar export protein FliJ
MAAFRFRAGVVLDLRRREEQAALAARAQAEARFREAKDAVAAEEARRQASQRDIAALQRRGADLGTLLWHRNWIDRLAGEVERLRGVLDERARQVQHAAGLWHDARRRRLALERMRDRAWQRFQREELRSEQKAMDELARIRHVMPDVWRSEP